MGLLPLTAVIAMRPELWFVLSAMWPCAYNTNSCGVAPEGNLTAGQPFIDAGAMRQLRDDMRQGMFIDINGHTGGHRRRHRNRTPTLHRAVLSYRSSS
jgi:hypothetical protein